MCGRLNFKNKKMRTEKEKTNTQKIADFTDKSLLIVDDDNPFRDRLSRAMEKKGFQVTQAESVEKGIIQAKKTPPAFIAATAVGILPYPVSITTLLSFLSL